MKKSVVFFYVDYGASEYSLMAQMMTASVHMSLPDYSVVMLTDNDSARVPGVDYVARANQTYKQDELMTARMQMIDAYIKHTDEQVIFADPDILFMKELDLFDTEYDIGLTWREEFPAMPFNTGVMTSRCTAPAKSFWNTALDVALHLPSPMRKWYGDQLAISAVVGINVYVHRDSDEIFSHDAKIKLFPCAEYNFSPNEYQPCDARILHLKGKRKAFMSAFFRDLCREKLGIKTGTFHLSTQHLPLLMQQRPQYKSIDNTTLGSIEEVVATTYTLDLFNEFREIKSFLPPRAQKILDIGCGIGGLNYFIYQHYQSNNPLLFLLDKSGTLADNSLDEKVEGGLCKYFDATKSLLVESGVPADRLKLIDVDLNSFPTQENFDLIISSNAWGLHFPLVNYLEQAVKTLNQEGRIILDIKKGSDGVAVLAQYFSDITLVSDSVDSFRVCASGKKPIEPIRPATPRAVASHP